MPDLQKISDDADMIVCGYYLYFTSKCFLEAMHVHAMYDKWQEYSKTSSYITK